MSVTASIVIPAYNSREDYLTCLRSLEQQSFRSFEVIWVDSASPDRSADLVTADFPWVRVIKSETNLGYRGGARIGANAAEGEFVVIMNQDVECAPLFLERLLEPMRGDATIGITAPLILHYSARDIVNEAGNAFHFSGLYGSRGLDAPRSNYTQSGEIGIVSGCCFCIRTELWRELGGFSEDFEAYQTGFHAGNEDQDMCWRARLAGYRVWLCADSELFHKFIKKPWSGGKLNSYFYSYWLVLMRNYRWRSLAALSPAIAVNVLLLWLRAACSGNGTLRMLWATQLWLFRHRAKVMDMRRRVQAGRKVDDFTVVSAMECTLTVSQNPVAQSAYSAVSTVYYQVFRALLFALRA